MKNLNIKNLMKCYYIGIKSILKWGGEDKNMR
jgi:hypothetical protein